MWRTAGAGRGALWAGAPAGQYLNTISAAEIATGWWEGEAITGRSRKATEEGLDRIRQRLPFRIREIHPDNDTGLINDLLWRYCRKAKIKMSRSRPYQKNDNAWVEQRNWTHVRKVLGYRRMDTTGELMILRDLYARLTLHKNFFQPTMKLKEKVRVGGKFIASTMNPRRPTSSCSSRARSRRRRESGSGRSRNP